MPQINDRLPENIPPHLDKWNWGAFLLNWIWGIGNRTYIALLMFVPIVNLVIWFMLGFSGSRWAWKNQFWRDEEHFKSTQRKWSIAGVVVLFAFLALGAGIFYSITSVMKSSDVYGMAMTQLRANSQVVETLGEPIEEGYFPTGNISITPGGGKAQLIISLSGSKTTGKAFLKAKRQDGEWQIYLLYFVAEGSKTPIVLINDNNIRIPGAAVGT